MPLKLSLLLIASTLHGQTVQGIPKEAEILETKPIPAEIRSNRALLIWMLAPEDHPISNLFQEQETCPDYKPSAFKRGQTRLSLVDTTSNKVINSVPVSYGEEDEFDLPYEAGSTRPEIIILRDVDGDGVAAEFFLYDQPACAGPETYVFGYSATKDRLAHYPFQLTDTEGTRVRRDSLRDFHLQKPTSLRHWNFKLTNTSDDPTVYDIQFVPERGRFEGNMDSKRAATLRK